MELNKNFCTKIILSKSIQNKIESHRKILLGLQIHDFEMDDLIELLDKIIIKNEKIIIYGYSANIYSRLKKMPEFVFFFQNMDIIIADGQGIPILARIFGIDIKRRIGIVNLANNLLELANKKKYKVLLFGATPEMNIKANENIKRLYPNIKLCRGIDGYFKKNEEMSIVRKISEEKPDILYIGISSPIKEWFALNYKELLNVKIIVPCGGWIDVIGGKAKRPPFTLKWFPVTWIFRFLQEPRRLFKPILVTVLKFVFCIFPVLFVKHVLGIEKNPSIINHFRLTQ